jgi:pimeloyl-ACP methyl ester carboxylesterase
LRAAGVTDLRHALIPGAGHFAQQEAPEATWKLIAEFAGL